MSQYQTDTREVRCPLLIMIACGKGGVGKTLLTTTAYGLIAALHAREVEVIQIDSQDRLARTLNAPVVSVAIDDLKETRSDVAAGIKAFRPIGEAIDRAAQNGGTVLIDFGATQVDRALSFFELSDFADDLRDMKFETHVLVPVVAEPEALSQAAKAICRFREVLPEASLTLVENRRDGRLAAIESGTESYRIADKELLPALGRDRVVVMPKVEGGSWALFERHFLAPLDVVAMDVAEVMKVTGLPRAEARIARGDIAAYLAHMNRELEALLGLTEQAQ